MSEKSEESTQSAASKSRFGKTEPYNLIVTYHAIEQHRNRSGMGQATPMRIANELRNIAANGHEMVLKDKATEVKQMLSHNCVPARYFMAGKSIVVVVNDNVITTSHLGEAGKWVRKK